MNNKFERPFPRTTFQCDENDLAHAVLSITASDMAMLCGVGIDTATAWRRGTEPVPYMAYQLLVFRVLGKIPEGFGVWSGWRLIEDRIYPPDGTYKSAARMIEVMFIDHYRIDRQLTESQANHIEGLQRRHDFYKRQCGLEARWGMMLSKLFGETGQIPPAAPNPETVI